MLRCADSHWYTCLFAHRQITGFLYRAHPTLMTMERSSHIMDEIFESAEEEGKGRLLRIIQDFLVSEASKHSAKEKESTKTKSRNTDVNMDELVGNTDGFADSGYVTPH